MDLGGQLKSAYHRVVPDRVRRTYPYRYVRQFFWNRRLRSDFGVGRTKYARELNYWRGCFEREGGRLHNGHYEGIFLAMASERDRRFIADRVIADFGAGPRGSLEWANEARVRICIDVLADLYMRFGIGAHAAAYVTNTESRIPLPSDYVDVMFTLNALDHVDDLERSCSEIVRVIKPGGRLIASFNLHEPRTFAEPQTLTEERLDGVLLDHFRIEAKKTGRRGPPNATYAHMMAHESEPLTPGDNGFLWVRGVKR